MKIKLTKKEGVVLKTAQSFCEDDIVVAVENTNLIPENIKKNVEILGVTGTFVGESHEDWDDPSFEVTATATNIESGKSAYIDGKIISGTNDMAAFDSEFILNRTEKELILNRNLNTRQDLSLVVRDSNNLKVRNGDVDISYEGGTIIADNLFAENIKKDVTILGVTGTLDEALDTSDATATSSDILSGKTAYINGELVTGTIMTANVNAIALRGNRVVVPMGYYPRQTTGYLPTTSIPRPSITVGSTGAITASVNCGTGFITGGSATATAQVTQGSATTPATTITVAPTITIDSNGKITAKNDTSNTADITPTVVSGFVTKGTSGKITVSGSKEKQLTVQGATTYTPGTQDQTIDASTYLTGKQTIKGDSDLVASNIKKDVTIFGVKGTCDNSIKGVTTMEAGLYGNNDLGIDGYTTDVTGILIDGYNGNVAILNSKNQNKQTVVKVQGYAKVELVDNHTNNTITADNLLPENIKKDVNILGVVGTCEEDSGASVSGTTLVLGKASVSGTTVSV